MEWLGETMQEASVHVCHCEVCQTSDDNDPEKRAHHQMNLLLSRMDEQQRRWLVACESQKLGHGGDILLSRITGLNVETIRRGRRELPADLKDRPLGRIRRLGGGRRSLEKKIPLWRRT
jgi:hypothetical protein